MGKKDGGGEADQARADEAARQAKIRAGTTRIGQIFTGGELTPTGKLAAGAKFDPKAKYYDATGKAFVPTAAGPQTTYSMQPGGRSSPGAHGADVNEMQRVATTTPGKTAEQAFLEALTGGKVYSGVNRSAGAFGPDFFKKQRQTFLDYANPQLEDQYGKAQKELTFALDRGGNLNSSVRGQKTGDLQQLYDLNKQKIADEALSHETTTRTAVEDARANLVATLNATGDAEGAANSALTRAAALSAPAAYSPLSQLFGDFTAGLGTQAAQERAEAVSGGGYKARYNTGLFGGAGRVQVT
jgi:hypothetical protein